jgi:hypothetical protein
VIEVENGTTRAQTIATITSRVIIAVSPFRTSLSAVFFPGEPPEASVVLEASSGVGPFTHRSEFSA